MFFITVFPPIRVRTLIFSIKDLKLIFVTLIRRSTIIRGCTRIFQTIYYNILHYYFKIIINAFLQ